MKGKRNLLFSNALSIKLLDTCENSHYCVMKIQSLKKHEKGEKGFPNKVGLRPAVKLILQRDPSFNLRGRKNGA